MSTEGALRPGLDRKDQLWRGGAVIVGWTLILLILQFITGGWIDLIGPWRYLLFLGVGVALSWNYGHLWLAGRPPPPRVRDAVIPTAEISGPAGSTYVVITRPSRHLVRPDELGQGRWALYTVVWRAPQGLGDYALVLLWRLIGAFRGRMTPQTPSDQGF